MDKNRWIWLVAGCYVVLGVYLGLQKEEWLLVAGLAVSVAVVLYLSARLKKQQKKQMNTLWLLWQACLYCLLGLAAFCAILLLGNHIG